MELTKVIVQRRTRRKFTKEKVPYEKLKTLIEYARFAPMGANIQGLKYAILNDDNLVEKIFPFTAWSGYHPEDAPSENEKPTSYIAVLGDTDIKPNGNFETDAGAAGTIISLVAEDMGIASCWIGSINKKEISKLLNLSENYKLLYLIAVGNSDQQATYVDTDEDIKYFTDSNGVLNVPKRKTEDILIKL